ncbi:MAG: hypothetical protein R3332_08435 [Pseudohongiellaceae bacterium]|nr:hypothetical protein [Pseudohongiellaceae bacterium]
MDLFLLAIAGLSITVIVQTYRDFTSRRDTLYSLPSLDIDDFYSSASIEFWSQIYQSNPALHRVSFDSFMLNPKGYVRAHIFDEFRKEPDDLEPLPLLPRQADLRDHLQRIEDEEYQANVLAEKELRELERRYQTISNNNGRLHAPTKSRRPKKWQTRGTHLKHA